MENNVNQMTTHAKTAGSDSFDEHSKDAFVDRWNNLTAAAPDFIYQLIIMEFGLLAMTLNLRYPHKKSHRG